MLQSMTGFGRATQESNGIKVHVELRSLNAKMLDLKIKAPQNYREKEIDLRRTLGNALERGKIDVLIEITAEQRNTRFINKEVFDAYYRELRELTQHYREANTDLFAIVCRMPEVMNAAGSEPEESEWELVNNTLQQAIAAFDAFRYDEGKGIEVDLRARVQQITQLLEETAPFEQQRIDKIKQRFRQAMEELGSNVDNNRFEQELIYYIERLDVSEEKQRLKQHCDYFLTQLQHKDKSKGKVLNFIAQEMGREINTLGSKANHAEMQRLVIQMKDELEKLKEQLANVL